MSVIHETKIEHAHDAALGLSDGALTEPARSNLTTTLLQAYKRGEDIPEDGSGAEQIVGTIDLLSQARLILEGSLNNGEATQEIRTLIRKITEAETAVKDFDREVQNPSI